MEARATNSGPATPARARGRRGVARPPEASEPAEPEERTRRPEALEGGGEGRPGVGFGTNADDSNPGGLEWDAPGPGKRTRHEAAKLPADRRQILTAQFGRKRFPDRKWFSCKRNSGNVSFSGSMRWRGGLLRDMLRLVWRSWSDLEAANFAAGCNYGRDILVILNRRGSFEV
jgi:hypothetical protein